jgi:Mg-chelatase subunit ChlD
MTKDHFCRMHKACKSPVSLQAMEKNIIFSLDANLGINAEHRQAVQAGVVALYTKICNRRDRVGLALFACASSTDLGFHLTEKSPMTSQRLATLPFGTAVPILQAPLSDGFHQPLSMVERSHLTTWIVVVTECQSCSDHKDWDSVQAVGAALNRDQSVHLLVVGINMSETMISSLRSICRSRKSALIETKGDPQSMSDAFAEVASIIGGGVTLRGFGMEKF